MKRSQVCSSARRARSWVAVGLTLLAVACQQRDLELTDGTSALSGVVNAVAPGSAPARPGPSVVATTAEPLAANGEVAAGFTSDPHIWTDGFSYRTPTQHRAWLSFLEARDTCLSEGLGLCSVQQWTRACAVDPTVAQIETWTTSYLTNGRVWTRGGLDCQSRRAVELDDRSPARGLLCCDRKPAIEVVGKASAALAAAAHVYMSTAQRVMNQRDPEQVVSMAQDEFNLYTSKRRSTRAEALKNLGFDLKNASEWDTRLVRCQSEITESGQVGHFECETAMVRKATTIPHREVALLTTVFHFQPPNLKYDKWALGKRIVRRYAPVE